MDERDSPRFLKMRVTPNLKQVPMKKFTHAAFADSSVIHSDGYRSYIPALEGCTHEHSSYDPNSGLLHWLHAIISNTKAFFSESIMVCPKRIFKPMCYHSEGYNVNRGLHTGTGKISGKRGGFPLIFC